MSFCTIELDNYQNEYHPRNTIEGRVVCTFYKPKTIKEIRIELRAEENSFWTILEPYFERGMTVRCERNVEYKGCNKILSVEKSLVGEGELEPGHYEYPFTFDLPADVPSTFSDENGSIKFFLKATVDRKYQINYEKEIDFKVVAPIDLNLLQKDLALLPTDRSAEKSVVSPFCCANGPVVMDVHVPRKAFVQGESTSVKVVVSNMSREKVQFVRLTLDTEYQIMVTTPIAQTRTHHRTLMTGQEGGVDAHSERTYDFKLVIPKSVVVPNFSLCTLLKHKAWITVVAATPYIVTLDVTIPIIIGQIPIEDKGEIEKMKSVQQSAHAALSSQTSQGNQLPSGGKPVPPSSGTSAVSPSAPPPEDHPAHPPPSYDTIFKS